jgi:methionyl-tRNA synthetase
MEINKISRQVGDFLQKNETDRGLKRILEFSKYFNQYFQRKQPWKNQGKHESSDTTNAKNPSKILTYSNATTLFIAANAVSSLAILLEPFIPFSSEKIWSQLRMGISSDLHRQPWDYSSKLNIEPGHIITEVKPIFRKVEIKDLTIEKSKIQRTTQ